MFLGPAAGLLGDVPSGPGPGGLSIHRDDLVGWRDVRRLLVSQSSGSWFYQGRYFTKAGDTRWFAFHAVGSASDGSALGLVIDVTSTVEAETATRKVAALREQLVAREHMASLGELTAGIAHEIKNPLNFVSNFAALSIDLLDELKTSLAAGDADVVSEVSEILVQNLRKIVDHSKRADVIVRSMLLHARGGVSERRPTDLNLLLEEAFTLAYHGARARSTAFKCSCITTFDPAVGKVPLVAEEIARVVLNLVGNALYAVDKRRREMVGHDGADAYQPTVEIATHRAADHVEISIRDNGIGIPESVLAQIFVPFFTTKPPGEGTGLGLSLSSEIIHHHDGTLTCRSVEGSYTHFTITLPLPPTSPRMVSGQIAETHGVQ